MSVGITWQLLICSRIHKDKMDERLLALGNLMIMTFMNKIMKVNLNSSIQTCIRHHQGTVQLSLILDQ